MKGALAEAQLISALTACVLLQEGILRKPARSKGILVIACDERHTC